MQSLTIILLLISFQAFSAEKESLEDKAKILITNCKKQDLFLTSRTLLQDLSAETKKDLLQDDKLTGNLLAYVHSDLIPKDVLFHEHFLICWSQYIDFRRNGKSEDFKSYEECILNLASKESKKNVRAILACLAKTDQKNTRSEP